MFIKIAWYVPLNMGGDSALRLWLFQRGQRVHLFRLAPFLSRND
jgi:hypothetical protein